MRPAVFSILILGAVLAGPAKAGPNVPFCLALETNYRDCVRAQQARDRNREEEREWRREEMEREGVEPEEWEHMRRHRHHEEAQGDPCAPMLVELKANGCF
ncbi:hypothetical protein [Methylocystis heyeri]|uniref:Uncharacterized protein n=1 Tax=Methylocystis heyeri TaxID=391905 RepID=A0A6B8KFK5_9HYPH|nr:hypothetical protein [Methylocystis heyeri]QGM45781.1 hypothetical protein H2LOC_008740 [Methylocystis heyeri]